MNQNRKSQNGNGTASAPCRRDVLLAGASLVTAPLAHALTARSHTASQGVTWKNGTPSNNGFVHRGVSCWADGETRRILFGTGDGYLICLDATTGKPLSSFGQNGRIDLTQELGRMVNRSHYGVSSPPIICRDIISWKATGATNVWTSLGPIAGD